MVIRDLGLIMFGLLVSSFSPVDEWMDECIDAER